MLEVWGRKTRESSLLKTQQRNAESQFLICASLTGIVRSLQANGSAVRCSRIRLATRCGSPDPRGVSGASAGDAGALGGSGGLVRGKPPSPATLQLLHQLRNLQ